MFKNDIHVLGIGETWLDDSVNDTEIAVDGYRLIRNDRNRHGGGVMFFVSDNISYKQVNFPSSIESIWITVDINKKLHTIGDTYRPPRSNSDYFESMMDVIEQANSICDNLIILGDLNYDYKTSGNTVSCPVHQIENMFGMKQLVQSYTRETITSSTLIDVILSNVPDQHATTRVLPVSMSDHFPVITTLRSQQPLKAVHNTVQFRDYKHFVVSDFLNDLETCFQNDQNLYNTTNNETTNCPEKLWHQFKTAFQEISNKHAPTKTMRLKRRYCPWMNREIINLMYKRDNLHKKAVVSKCPDAWNNYTLCRNKVTSMIRQEKNKYFENELCNNVSSPRQFWKTINRLTGKSIHTNAPNEISAQEFNNYFSKIGHAVVNDNMNNYEDKPLVWKNPPCQHIFKFSRCNNSDVLSVIKSFGTDSSVDVIGFDSKLLYIACQFVAPIITNIINASLFCGKLPADWKFSRVTPVYKNKGSKDDKNNYRPISVIGHVAKIAEKVVQRQLLDYLLSRDLIVIDQSAYRPMHNTQTALHRVVDSWIDNINDGLLTGVCLLDIRKCFDTINHNLLKEKLSYYGVTGTEHSWFADYLDNRSQIVFHNQSVSEKSNVSIGVPQGSVLGPILFMLFVNDISQNCNVGVCNLYADDTIVYCDATTVSDVERKLQACVSQLNDWYVNNKLSVNTSKSEVMLISSKRRCFADHLDIVIDGINLKYVECANYLGMSIDNVLSWNEYVNKLCSNVASKLSGLRRLKGVVSSYVMRKVFVTAVQPCIDYAISVWGQTSDCNIKKIQRLQNYAARLVTNNFDYINCRSSDIIKALKWMDVKQRCMYFTITLMFKCIHGLAPIYLVNDIVMNCNINVRTTRSHAMNVYVPSASSEFAKRSFMYSGAVMWNALPSFLKDIRDLNNFKFKLKQYIFNFQF